MIPNNIKTFQSLCFGIILLFFSCTPKCPEIESIMSKGNKVNISMIECRSSDIVFEINLDLKILEDIQSNGPYVHIPQESIQLTKYKDFDYVIDIIRRDNLTFSMLLKLEEGNNVDIKGTDFKRDTNNAILSVGPNWSTSFEFNGLIQELSKGVYQTQIESPATNISTLRMFDSSVASFNQKHSFVLSVNE